MRPDKLSAERTSERGFSLLELAVATGVFTVLAAVIFSVLLVGMQRYQMESAVMTSFQQAGLAMDQIIRDAHSTGYPPINAYTTAVATASPALVAQPFGWTPAYPATPCTVGGTCITPSAFDVIFEEDTGTGVQWIRYQLQGTTLMRGTALKIAGLDPAAATAPSLTAYVDNVMNNATAAQMATIRAAYPTMFPGNAPVPLFTYTCDGAAGGAPGLCTGMAAPNNTVVYVRDVNIALVLQSDAPDPRTHRVRVVTLTGQARRINPSS